MQRREEKRRKLHEALLQTLYPPPSPPAEVEDKEPFDVTLINPVDSSSEEDDNEIGEESELAAKPSRAQRKRLRKKMLKEEAARRRKVIGPLLPIDMIQTRDPVVGDAEEEAGCSQPVRRNAPEEKQEKFGANDKTNKVKKRREAKKLAKEKKSIPIS